MKQWERTKKLATGELKPYLENPFGANPYNHAEAFCLMNYKCKSCENEEKLWNSRDGVTPFIIDCKNCKGEAYHINFHLDKRLPDYKPIPGQRIFVDMTEEKKKDIAEKRFMQAQGTPFEIPLEEKDEFIKEYVADFHEGTPDIEIIE